MRTSWRHLEPGIITLFVVSWFPCFSLPNVSAIFIGSVANWETSGCSEDKAVANTSIVKFINWLRLHFLSGINPILCAYQRRARGCFAMTLPDCRWMKPPVISVRFIMTCGPWKKKNGLCCHQTAPGRLTEGRFHPRHQTPLSQTEKRQQAPKYSANTMKQLHPSLLASHPGIWVPLRMQTRNFTSQNLPCPPWRSATAPALW